MFKALAKLKPGKEKTQKKEKPDKKDEAQSNLKHNIKLNADKESRRKSRRKNKGTSLNDDASLDGRTTRGHSIAVFEDHSDIHRVKEKHKTSKECEEMVKKAVALFFDCAWKACAERFFITSAPVTVSFELRNTWLRIVEAEWQDPDMREKPATKPNRIFRRDEPPLPLTFDSWSRGALEPLPRQKRESVMDPFLRSVNYYKTFAYPDRLPSASNVPTDVSADEETHSELLDTIGEARLSLENEVASTVAATTEEKQTSVEDTPETDKWDFDLDPKLSLEFEQEEGSGTNLIAASVSPSDNKVSPESTISSGGGIKTLPLETILSPRQLTLISTTETDISATTDSSEQSTRGKIARTKFSPSQCGGRSGSGVYLLPLETTSEALVRMAYPNTFVHRESVQIDELNAVAWEDIVQLTKKGETTQKEEEEVLEIQPLFEEQTPKRGGSDDMYHFEENAYQRPFYNEVKFTTPSIDQVASEINKKFLKRRMINLHGHFKRQALRSLAARAKQSQARAVPRTSSSSSTSTVISKSTVLSKSSKNGTIQNANKSEKQDGTLHHHHHHHHPHHKMWPSRSVSNVNLSRVNSTLRTSPMLRRNTIFPDTKGISSEPQISSIFPKRGPSLSQSVGQGKNLQAPSEGNKNKGMANVRKSPGLLRPGKFADSRNSRSVLQSRFENIKRPPCSEKRGRTNADVCQRLQTTPSDCPSINTYCRNICP